MVAITSDALRNIALAGAGASVLLSIVLAIVIRSVVGKLVSLVITVAIALALYTQQDQLKNCAEKIQNKPGQEAVCTFFGRDVTINVPSNVLD